MKNRSALPTHTVPDREAATRTQRTDLRILPKGTDLSIHSQEKLGAIAHRLNTRPRAVLNFKIPIEVFAEHMDAVIESRHAVRH